MRLFFPHKIFNVSEDDGGSGAGAADLRGRAGERSASGER